MSDDYRFDNNWLVDDDKIKFIKEIFRNFRLQNSFKWYLS